MATNITKIYTYASFEGINFYPSIWINKIDIEFSQINDPGDMGIIGKYKDRPIPFGSAITIEFSNVDEYNDYDSLDILTNKLYYIRNFIPKMMIDELTVWIIIANSLQSSFAIRSETILKLGELGANIALEWYKD